MREPRGRRIAGSLWLFLFVLVASAGGIVILGSAAQRGTSFEPFSTFRAEPDGAMALHDYLAHPRNGFECRRETEELLTLPDDGSLLVLIHPYKEPEAAPVATATKSPFQAEGAFSNHEVDFLLAWVKRGGRLLVFECFDNPLFRELGVSASGVATLQDQPVGTARPAALSTLTVRGGRLALACRATVSAEGGAWTPLFVDEDGRAVLMASDWGAGRVFIVSDPTIATNAGIGRASHVAILHAIAQDLPGAVGGSAAKPGGRLVRFDELRHGFRTERNVMGFARRYGLHVVLVQAGLAFVMTVWAGARPRRRVRGAGLEKGIESREFVSAMANIYARASVDQHAIASYRRRCERAITLAIGVSPDETGREEVAKRLAALGVRNYHGWESVHDEAVSLSARGAKALGERRLVNFARLATQLEREVREAARLTVDQVIS